MLKVQAIENSGAVGPLMVILNLSLVAGLLAAFALKYHKLKQDIGRDERASWLNSELTRSHADSIAVDGAGYPAASARTGRGMSTVESAANPMTLNSHVDDKENGAAGIADSAATAAAAKGKVRTLSQADAEHTVI